MAETVLIEIIDLFNWEPLQRTSRAQMLFKELEPRVVDDLLEEFANYIMNFLKSLVLNAIRFQKFPGKPYQPLSPAYLAKKKKKGWRLGFWEMTGFLQQHISIWKNSKRNYCIGFKHGLVHPVSGYPIENIARVLEKGYPKGGIPARPLFYPLATAISKTIYDTHWKKFLKTKHMDLYKKMMYEEFPETKPKAPPPKLPPGMMRNPKLPPPELKK